MTGEITDLRFLATEERVCRGRMIPYMASHLCRDSMRVPLRTCIMGFNPSKMVQLLQLPFLLCFVA